MIRRNQPRGQLRGEESRGPSKSRNSHSVLEEGAGGMRGEGWEMWLEQGSYILSGFMLKAKR